MFGDADSHLLNTCNDIISDQNFGFKVSREHCFLVKNMRLVKKLGNL